MELILSAENTRSAIIELLIKNLATQRAGIDIMISLLAVDNEEAKQLTNRFNDIFSVYSNQIFEDIYARLHTVDLVEILK